MRSTPIRLLAICVALLLVPACAVGGACGSACSPCDAPAPAVAAVTEAAPCYDNMCAGESSRPPTAKPGEAWCRVWQPPTYKTVSKRVLVTPATRKKLWIPPEYGSRMKVVCVSPAKLSESMRPGLYTTRKKDVLVCPPQADWARVDCGKQGRNADGTINCECYAKTMRPPTFRTESRRVCLQPEQSCLTYKAAEYKCVEERVLIKDGFCQTVCTPAQYKTCTKQVVCRPGCWRWVRDESCEVPVEPELSLPALEVRMEDKAPDGADAGIFEMGSIVRYDLVVLSDAASQSMPNLRVRFSLPEHLEFVEGKGSHGITITGAGQAADSDVFPLEASATKELTIFVKVISVPATNLVQLTASVQTEDGTELAIETESTTLKRSD